MMKLPVPINSTKLLNAQESLLLVFKRRRSVNTLKHITKLERRKKHRLKRKYQKLPKKETRKGFKF